MIEIGTKVMLKHNGLHGTVIGVCFTNYKLTTYEIKFIDFDKHIRTMWLYEEDLKVTNLKDRITRSNVLGFIKKK